MDGNMLVKMTDSMPEEQNVEELKRDKPEMRELVEEQCVDQDGEKIKEEECEMLQNAKISSNKSFHCEEFMSALTKEKDEETIERSSYMALDVKSSNTLGASEEQGKAVEDGSSATTGTTDIEELWGKEQPNDDKELSTSMNAEVSNLWHDEPKVINTEESVSLVNKDKIVEPNATEQDTDEILNKEENMNDELETAPQIETREVSLHEEEFKDEKSEEVINQKSDVKNPEGTADASSATQLTAEEETQQIEEVPAAQDEVQCVKEVLGHDELDTQLPMQDVPEVSETGTDDNLVEGESQSGTHNDELERVHEDKEDTMTTVQTKSSDGESNYIISSLQPAKPSEKKKSQALPDVNITQDNALMEVERESGLLKPFDAVYHNIEAREEIDNLEKENTCQEELTVKEQFEEDEKEYEMKDGFVHNYQDPSNETVPANGEDGNTEEDAGDLPAAHESSEETLPKGEMQESGVTSSSQDLVHDTGDNLHQQTCESGPENFMNNSELISEGPSSKTVAEAEVTNTDVLASSVKVLTTVTSPSFSQATIQEDTEEAMGHKEPVEERIEVVDNNEDHDRHTYEAIIENMIHEDSTKFEDTNPEDEENDTSTAGVSSLEQLEGEKLSEGDELVKEKVNFVLAADSHKCLGDSKTEETQYCDLEKEKHEMENDPNLVFETIIKAKHSVVSRDNDDEHLEKQECIKDNYNPHDKLKETVKEKDEDEDLQDIIGQKHEEDLNYPHEQEILETANTENNIVDDGGHTSQTAEMVLESEPEQKSQDQMDEMETTKIDKSMFDDNFSNMNATNELCEETAMPNEMIANTNENEFVEATIQEKVHEDPTDSICKEKNQNMTNDIDMVQEEMEFKNSEKASQFVFAEHQHNEISGSEAACIYPSEEDNSKEAAFGDLCTSQASKKENTQKQNDPEDANEDIPALNNDYESHDSNAGAAEVIVEKEIHQTEDQRCKEDETATGMSSPQDNKIQREKTDPRSESEASESPTLSVDPEICPGETITNKASLEVNGSEDQLGNSSDVSEKSIVDETSISTRDVEEMDRLEKQKESLQEKAEVLVQRTIGSEDNIRNPSDAVYETIMAESSTSTQDVDDFLEKQEKIFHEKAEVSRLKIVGSEDKVENPSDVISEKIIMAETITSNQDAKEMDLLGKQEENFKEKGEVTVLLEHVVDRTGTDNPNYEEDDASLQVYVKDAEAENQEIALKDLNSTYVEQTYGTINISNKIEREPSQKLEFVAKSALEVEDREASMGKKAGKLKNSLDDDSFKRMIPETLEPSDSNENAKEESHETTQDEYIGNNHDSCLQVEEIVHSAISKKHTEGQSSAYEEQTYQSVNLEGIIQGDVSKDKKDIEKLGIPSESLIEIEVQKEIEESVFTEMDSSIDDESSKMMHEVAKKVKDEKSQRRALEEPQSPDSHALVLPIRSESNDEKYEESSKSVFKEQCHQTTSVGEKTEADVHKERTDSEGLDIIEEKVEIPEIVADSDDSQTMKEKGEVTLEEDISTIPNTGELLLKTTNNEVGEDHEYDNNISNSKDTVITGINKEKGKNDQLDTESEYSEKARWLMTEEHQHNKISGLEVNIDPSTGCYSTDKVFGDLCTSQASEEENTQKAAHPEEANEDIPALNNDNEGQDSNAGAAEVVIEKEIHERTEELICNEDETATRMSLLHDDKIQREKIDRSELEASESPTISVDPVIYLDETTADKASLEVIGSEDKNGNPSDVVSEKTIMDETSTSTQDVEKMDLLEKQKESFQEKAEVIMLPTIGSEDETRNLSDAVSQTIMAENSSSTQDVEEMDFLEKQEENFHEKDEVNMLQIVGSEDKVESPFEVVSEKIIMDETIASNEEAKEMDLLAKQEENFQEKAEVTMLPEIEVAKMGTDNPTYKADDASLEFNNEAEGEKQEGSPKDLNCTYAEQTNGTINTGNKVKRETSQELEFVSKSANEDEDQGANIGKQASKIRNSLDDGSLKRMIPETLEPSNWNENANDETTQAQHIGKNRDSCLLVDEIVHSAINEKHTEGQSSVDEEQTDKSANLEGIIQGNINEDKKEMEKLGIPSGSFVKIQGQEEIRESVFTEMDSSIDDENSKMIHVVAEQVKDEENLSKAVEEPQFLDSHALVLPRTSEPNDENYKESSKFVFEEQCRQTTNLGEKTEANVHKERTDSDSLQIIEEKVKAEDALEEDTSNTPNRGEMVEKATNDGVGEDHEFENNITNSEDTMVTDINNEKAKIDQLDIESDLRPDDPSQIMHGDKESVKVEEAPSLENETQSSTVKQMTSDGGSRVEKNVKAMAYELKYDEILEHNSICKSTDEDVQKNEEPLNNFIEKSVSSERADCAEADSGRKLLDEEAKDANFVSVVCKENQKFDEAKPTNTCSDQDNEIKEVNDSIKSETATDEVKESQIASAAQKSESLAEMKPDKFQLPDYGSQTMNANVQEDQTCTTRGNNNDADILELINMDEHTKNKDESTNKILDSSPASSGLTDKEHRNLDGDWDGSTIEIDYSKDVILNKEVDSELRSIEQNREVRKDTNPIEVETSVNDNHSFITRHKEPEAVDLNYEQGIANTNNNDNLPVFTAFDEKDGEEVQKKNEKDPESSSEDQIDEGHIKNIYLATLKEQDKIVELEKDIFSLSSEQNGNRIIGTDILQNDQVEANSSAKRIATPMEGDGHCHDGKEVSEVMGNSPQDEAKVNDANVSCSSKQSQGKGGDELNMASVEEIETFESEKKEENTMDQEALDASPSEIKLIVAAEVKHLYPQRIKIEERTLTEAKIEESNLLSQEVMERTNGLSTVEALFEGNMPKNTSTVVLSENQSHDGPGHINIEEMAVLEKQNEEMQKVQPNLFDEVGNEKREEENNIQTEQIESETMNTNDTADEERQISKVASDKAKPGLETPLHEVPKGLETTPGTENIYKDRIEKQNLEEKLLMDENKMLIKSEGENQTNEPIHDSGSIECAIPHEEIIKAINTGDEVAKVGVQYEASKCHMVDSLYVSDELFEETKKRETSGSYKQMTSPELESLEKGDEISTQNDEITETSAKLDESSRCDTKESMQLEAPSSTVSKLEKVESDMYTETKIEAKEDAFESTSTARVGDITVNEQFQEEENESTKDKEPEANWKPEITYSTPKDVVEICDSKLVQIGLSEKPEKTLPIDDEDLIKSLSAENAKQETAEKFGKIADYKPIGCTEQTCDANELGIELPMIKGSTGEYPAEIEKLMNIADDTASVSEIHVNDRKVPYDIPCVLSVSESSEEDTVVKKYSVNPTDFSNLQSDEDKKESSSVEVTVGKEISHKIPTMPDPELQSPEEERERAQLEEEASCEAVEFSDLQDEKKQQSEGNNLPVSQLLMEHILSEEKVKPDKACDVGAEDNTLHGGGEQNDGGIPREERILVTDETIISRHSVGPDELQTIPGKFESENKIHEKLDEGDQNGARTEKGEILVSFSPGNATGKTSISEDNVGQEKLEIGSPLVEENQVCASNEKTEIPVVKDDVKPKNSPRDSSPTMSMSEEVKDAAPSLTEIPSCGLENDSREPTLTEKRNTENKMDIEDCILTASVQNEKVQETVLEKYPKEQTNKKSEVLNGDVLPLVLETSHEDNLLEEGSKEGKAILQDVQKRGKASYEVLEGQYPSNAEPVGETKGLVHSKETLPNPKYDSDGKSSSNIKDDLHGQTSEIESEVKMVENEVEGNDGFTGNQVPREKKKSTGKSYLSELQEVDQSNLAVKSTDQTLEIAKNLPDGKILAVHTDEQVAVGITEAQADEDNSEGENDEYKPEESGNDARVMVEARDADLKPAHKKSQNILSGVGSKFKHSLSKVKKAITGKSSHSKTSPAK